ncbi:MAG: FtsX-like permease family protein [Gammaproteobacteria bacterium]|uniref:FtsX-like permease family protein n=1 Tax=SAR86 cluster bacterium TaxID=2030880 RepID=A0A520N171_9GAMM|nr:ABC transporter permease [SAR86 cluster bacterium]RZO27175.1 MAG: FtsX-like permease family protein [SAR86 cluster bacterium]
MNNLLNKISFSYLLNPGTKRFSSLSIFTTVGIAIGTSVVIIVMSVMNGFQNELKERILGAVPQVIFERFEKFENIEEVISKAKQHPNVIGAQEYLMEQSILSSKYATKGVVIKGTDEKEISIIAKNIIEGSLKELKDGANIILGDSLAYKLGVLPGEQITLIVASDLGNIMTMPRAINFLVIGLFSVGSEVDQNYALIGKDSFTKAFSKKRNMGIELRLDDVLDAENTGEEVLKSIAINSYTKITTWEEVYGSLFRATQLERTMVSLLMSLILLIAVFSMVLSINHFVKDKESEIAMLRTIGYSKNEILRIFLQITLFIGIIGIFLGNLLGVIFSNNITEFFNFLADIFNINVMNTYYVDYFPSIVMFEDILLINGCSIILIILLGFIPANKAAKTNPVKILNKK